MKTVLALVIAVFCLAGTSAIANLTEEIQGKSENKIVEVKVCPISGEPISGVGSGSEVVGNNKVYFCCEGCKAKFDKLSKEEKDQKIAAALEKQNSTKKENK
jgi:hypothetical protein